MKPSTSAVVDLSEKSEQNLLVTSRPLLHIVKGRDAMNFCEFPLATLSDRVPGGQRTLEFEDTLKYGGKEVSRKLTITASDKYGLPTAMDDEVAFGLIQLSHAHNFAQRKVPFTRYDLIRILGWRNDGRSYQRILESLMRWLSVTLIYKKAWWDNEEEIFVNEAFHILEHVMVLDRERFDHRRSQGKEITSSFTWNEVVFRSFQAGYLKEVDLDTYRSLQSAVAKRLYRFLDKRLYQRGRWEFDLHQLCCHKLGMSERSHTGELKRCLMTGIEELEAKGLLRARTLDERFIKQKAGVWKVILEEGTGKAKSASSENDPLAARLIDRGVRPAKARELSRGFASKMIEDRIAYHDWLLERKDQRISKSPAGFLVGSIQGEYPLPSDFTGSIPKRATKARPKSPMSKTPAPIIEPTDDAFAKFWDSIDDATRVKLEAAAQKSAKPFLLDTFDRLREKGGPLFESVRQEIVSAHLRSSGLLPQSPNAPEQRRGE